MLGEFKPKLKHAVSRAETASPSKLSTNGHDDEQRDEEKRPRISPAEQIRQFRRLAEQLMARR